MFDAGNFQTMTLNKNLYAFSLALIEMELATPHRNVPTKVELPVATVQQGKIEHISMSTSFIFHIINN
jgi:hypothetical protein